MRLVRETLCNLGYVAIPSAKYYQFVQPAGESRNVKLDLLVGPLGEHVGHVKADARRVRPKPSVDLHAHPVNEAIALEDEATTLEVGGRLSDGTLYRAMVYIPHPFTYILMKLCAFDDRKHDEDKDLGRHHALDLYRIVAMLTEVEYNDLKRLSATHRDDEHVKRAAEIIEQDFGDTDDMGAIRLREHQLFKRDMDVEKFLAVLKECFPSPSH